ncbi:hypothetical protein INR49_006465 [Caranx melampygus]|nr:hypothetical protein INR49_006465 [Caranx melampygus]
MNLLEEEEEEKEEEEEEISVTMIFTLIYISGLLLGVLTSPAPPSPPTTNATDGPCRIHNLGRSADCLGRQLSSVPWRQFPPTLQDIDLSYNRLQALGAEDFARLPLLRKLVLSYNNISHIDNDAFKNNPQLEHLDIFNNSLQQIPVGALTPLLNLKQLFMSNNLYKHATLDDSFSKFVKLQVLSMGGPLVMGLKKADFQALKNITLSGFAIKCSSNLSYYEPGSLEVIRTMQMGFDMAIDQRPGALLHMIRDIAHKKFIAIQFRNLFEFMYYNGQQDIFEGLKDVTAHQLIFHRGKFNENLMRMALTNLQAAPIKRLRFQYIDFARSPTFTDSEAGSSITDLALDKLDLWYISNPDVLRFDWRFSWLKKIKALSIQYVYFNSVPCDSWVEMEGVKVLDVSSNRLQNEYIFNQKCNYRGTMPNLHTFNTSHNDMTSLKDLSSLTREFQRLQVLDISNNKLGSAENSQDCVWQKNITKLIAHHNQFVSEALGCLPTTVHYLDLSYCNLDQLDMTYFERATNLQELLLSGNKIKFIPSKWESPSLHSLSLDGNSFGLISRESFQDMPRLSRLRAGNNPYHCTCELHAFVQDTMSQDKVACDIRLVIVICVATTAVVIMILMLICYIFDLPWYTKATYQIIRAKYRAHKEKAAGELETFTYHAFISYSHSDADWVIFVLSRHFVNSEWCNYELYFAQQRAMGKSFSDVILVVKEPIDPSSLPSKYCKLKKMLSTKTYLEWPQQVNQQAFFWEQLRSILGKPMATKTRTHSIKSRTSSVGGVSVIELPSDGVEPEVAKQNVDQEAEVKLIDRNNDKRPNQTQIPVMAL